MSTRLWIVVVALTAVVRLVTGFAVGWFSYQAYLATSLVDAVEEGLEAAEEGLETVDETWETEAEPVEDILADAVRMGEVASDGIWEITVTKAERMETVSGSYSNAVASDGFEFLVLHVTAENVSSAPQMPDPSSSQVLDGDGRSFAYSSEAGFALDEDDIQYSDVNPSQTVELRIPFEVPQDVEMVGARLTASWAATTRFSTLGRSEPTGVGLTRTFLTCTGKVRFFSEI